MQSQAHVMPACDCMARLLKKGLVISIHFRAWASEGGQHHHGIGSLVVAPLLDDFFNLAGRLWRDEKKECDGWTKKKKARQTVPPT